MTRKVCRGVYVASVRHASHAGFYSDNDNGHLQNSPPILYQRLWSMHLCSPWDCARSLHSPKRPPQSKSIIDDKLLYRTEVQLHVIGWNIMENALVSGFSSTIRKWERKFEAAVAGKQERIYMHFDIPEKAKANKWIGSKIGKSRYLEGKCVCGGGGGGRGKEFLSKSINLIADLRISSTLFCLENKNVDGKTKSHKLHPTSSP